MTTTTIATVTDLNTGISRTIPVSSYTSSGGLMGGLGGGFGGWGDFGGLGGHHAAGGLGGFGAMGGMGGLGGMGNVDWAGKGFGAAGGMGGMPHGSNIFGGNVGDRKMMDTVGLQGILSSKDLDVMRSSWNILKRRGDFAPKVFIR